MNKFSTDFPTVNQREIRQKNQLHPKPQRTEQRGTGRKIGHSPGNNRASTIKYPCPDIFDYTGCPRFSNRYDRKINGNVTVTNQSDVIEPVLPTQQFGVTLEFIKENYQVTIPPVVKQCVEYLEQPDGKQNRTFLFL